MRAAGSWHGRAESASFCLSYGFTPEHLPEFWSFLLIAATGGAMIIIHITHITYTYSISRFHRYASAPGHPYRVHGSHERSRQEHPHDRRVVSGCWAQLPRR